MNMADIVLNRVIEVKKLKNDAALARFWRVKPNTLSNWRNRNVIPYNEIIQLCEHDNISLDYILAGVLPVYRIMPEASKAKGLTTEHIDIKEDDSTMSGAVHGAIKGDIYYNESIIEHDIKGFVVGENRSPTHGAGIKTNILRYPTELEPVVESFMAVMTSEDEDAKGSLARNVFTFHRTVTNERKIKKMEAEIFELRSEINNIKQQLLSMAKTDFKTAEATGEKQGGGRNGE
jgi:hypothetical protein